MTNVESQHEPVSGHPSLPVKMVREDLEDIPQFDLPAGYAIRWYAPGDEAAWMRIHAESEAYGELDPELFWKQYGRDVQILSERVAFVCDSEGFPVSTNTAWMNEWQGGEWGRVHWVATARSEQGKGLSKPMMTVICERLSSLGHTRAYLTTNTVRVRAIALYAAFGFRAYWEADDERSAWEALMPKLEQLGKPVVFDE